MECIRCRDRKQDWSGDAPQCAFKVGAFDPTNWNCATMNELRELAESRAVWSEDSSAALLPWDGNFIVLGWYKRRGRTDACYLLSGADTRPVTLLEVEAFLRESDLLP